MRETSANISGSTTAPIDVVVIGAGIVGLATAWRLQNQFSDLRIIVVEAAERVAAHQSGHNSGVLHSGIYYKPGSLKARTCRAGKQAMESFCNEHDVAWQQCGKVVVATTAEELPRLETIAERARANGVQAIPIDTNALGELEPFAAGLSALHVPETGIVDYAQVCERLQKLIIDRGGSVKLGFRVTRIESASGSSLRLTSARGEHIQCARIVNCGGLYSDRLCRMAGGETDVQIVPFRGEYYELAEHSQRLCRNLIYPVPDPAFPFLGVHFTRMIAGGVECGPNAVLALARQGYRWRTIHLGEFAQTMMFRGFRRMAVQHWRMGLGEMHRSVSKRAFVKALRKLVPSLTAHDLKPGRAGVRAQAITADGSLVDDFLIVHSANAIHVLNAPSPAATASLAIADQIVAEFRQLT